MATAATDHQEPNGHRGFRLLALMLAIVCAVLLAGCDSTRSGTAPAASSAPTTPAHDGMPGPTAGTGPAVRAYLAGAGAAVMGLHRQVAALVDAGTVRDCATTGSALHAIGSPAAISTAAAGVPDPVLTELATDELVATTNLLSGCQAGRSTTPLRGVDHELTVRLGQLGVTR